MRFLWEFGASIDAEKNTEAGRWSCGVFFTPSLSIVFKVLGKKRSSVPLQFHFFNDLLDVANS